MNYKPKIEAILKGNATTSSTSVSTSSVSREDTRVDAILALIDEACLDELDTLLKDTKTPEEAGVRLQSRWVTLKQKKEGR